MTLHSVYYREREPSVSVNYALVYIFLCQFLASRLLSVLPVVVGHMTISPLLKQGGGEESE